MAQYDKRRIVGVLDVPASTADNTNLQCFAEVAPGKTAQIYGLSAFIDTVSETSGASIEVVRSDAATTALCEVDINAASGAVKDSTTTFPVTVTNTSTTTSIFLRFRTNAATGANIDGQVFCQVSNEGVA